jgi:ACR3 family arsenite efflux pump ArsB
MTVVHHLDIAVITPLVEVVVLVLLVEMEQHLALG